MTPPDPLRDRLQRALTDDYEVRGLLGSGGFGAVFTAYDRKLKREVAVKVVRPELLTADTVLERFRREAQAVARLRHPNLVPIYAVGEGEGLAFFTMPRIDGDSLRVVLDREGRLAVDESIRVLCEVAGALAVAHRAGLVHRDIKPDNIMLEGPERRAVLMDFGVAKALEGDIDVLTVSGALVGTPLYMSPEQAAGESKVDGRADLYSLGVVGFQMVAGAPPFAAASARAIMAMHVTRPAPPVTTLREDCPAHLSAALSVCLAKDPGDRFENADALVAVLTGAADPPAGAAVAENDDAPAPTATAQARGQLPAPIQGFRRASIAFGSMLVVATLIDVVPDGSIQFAPAAWLMAVLLLGMSYGNLVTNGFTLRDVWLGAAREAASNSHVSTSGTSTVVNDWGEHRAAVDLVRNARAAVAAVLARLATQERARLAEVLPEMDRLVGRVGDVAKRLHRFDRRIEETRVKEAKMAATINGTAGGTWDLRSALAERQAKAIDQLQHQRQEWLGRLEQCVTAAQSMRDAMEASTTRGIDASMSDVNRALEGARRATNAAPEAP